MRSNKTTTRTMCSESNGGLGVDGSNPQILSSSSSSCTNGKDKNKAQVVVVVVSDRSESEVPVDPWALPELQDEGVKWSERSEGEKRRQICVVITKVVTLIALLYFFVCSLDFLSSAFRLLGGKTAGYVFKNNEQLRNPVAGLMIGILATVLVQSSSTSTSIIVTMVASEILDVPTAIPVIMGANVGTSITNTFVSFAQCSDRNEFRRAFAAATVHDMFNWLSVAVLLTVEVTTGYLYHLTTAIVDSVVWETKADANTELLTVLTKPFTSMVVQLDKKVIEGFALGDETFANRSLIKRWCRSAAAAAAQNAKSALDNGTNTYGSERCKAIFSLLDLEDSTVGIILLATSLVILCLCLIMMVKILNSMLRGRVAVVIKKTLNADLPGRFACLTGYLAILVGCCLTILVQSSSIFTSTLTPLVGVGVISLERMYPLTLGSNIGTTTTGILASLTATGIQLRSSVQIALCHLFFNLSGILLFFPIPFMRWPIGLARTLGDTTAKYRWFAIFYLLVAFLLLPAFVFALSACGQIVFMAVAIPLGSVLLLAIVINVAQTHCRARLPPVLRDWNFLPHWMHSLEPIDCAIVSVRDFFSSCCKRYYPGYTNGMPKNRAEDRYGTSRSLISSRPSWSTSYVFDNQQTSDIEMTILEAACKS